MTEMESLIQDVPASSPTRVVNVRKEVCDVYIGRGSVWGNPFTHLPLTSTKAHYKVTSREGAILAYRQWLLQHPELLMLLPTLREKALGCYCKPAPCHGDVLAELADQVDAIPVEESGAE